MFKVYDAMKYAGKPPAVTWGGETFKLFTEGTFLDSNNNLKSQAGIVANLAGYENYEGILCADVEAPFDANNPATIPTAIALHDKLSDWLIAACPKAKWGYYGYPPVRDYFAPRDRLIDPAKFAAWQALNDSIEPIHRKMHVCFPSKYTFYGSTTTDIANWSIYAKGNFDEAKRASKGRPIYAFLWPQFHENTPLGLQFIPGPFFRMQLELCKALGCAGIVLWSPSSPAWNDTAPWYLQLKDFVAGLTATSSAINVETFLTEQLRARRDSIQRSLVDFAQFDKAGREAEMVELSTRLAGIVG